MRFFIIIWFNIVLSGWLDFRLYFRRLSCLASEKSRKQNGGKQSSNVVYVRAQSAPWLVLFFRWPPPQIPPPPPPPPRKKWTVPWSALRWIAISELRKENWGLYLDACCHAEVWIHWLNLAWQFHPFVKLRVVSYLFRWAIIKWAQLHARAIQRTRDVSSSLVRVRVFHRFFYFSHQDLTLLTAYSFNWKVNLPVA